MDTGHSRISNMLMHANNRSRQLTELAGSVGVDLEQGRDALVLPMVLGQCAIVGIIGHSSLLVGLSSLTIGRAFVQQDLTQRGWKFTQWLIPTEQERP